MKKSFLLLVLFCIVFSSFAVKVPVEKAREIAVGFYAHYCLHDNVQPVVKEVNVTEYQNVITIYTINFEPKGFILIAADDAAIPVLAYSDESDFPRDLTNPATKEWIDGYSREIFKIITNKLSNKETLKKWNELFPRTTDAPTHDVNPLLATTWDQGCYYNALCPSDVSGTCGHVWTGCVATAMSQIMKYHNFPPQGVGSHSYVDPTYGLQSANFGNTTYNWSSMPNSVTGPNTQVATLMYHAGVSVDMQYATSGSGAFSEEVPYSLMNYFNYQPGVAIQYKNNYSNVEDFKDTIRADLDKQLPVYYSGSNPSEGHAFVCDGYRMSDGTFHFNWGWSGSCNGWYSIGALNPGGNTFNDNNSIVVHIKPYNPNLIVRITHPVNNAVIGVGYPARIVGTTVRGTSNLVKLFIDNVEVASSTIDSVTYTWNTSDPDLGSHLVKVIAYSATDTVYNTINLNVAEWISQASGFTTIRGINYMSAADSNNVWATGYISTDPTAACSDFTHTTDGGNTWIPGVITNTTGLASAMVFGMSASTAYVPMYKVSGSKPQGIYVTTDGGLTWNRQTTASFSNTSSFPDCVHFFNANEGWALGDPINGAFEIYTTTNGGTNWTQVSGSNIPAPVSGEFGVVGYYSAVNDTLWFGTNMGRVYHSSDKGHTWSVATVTPFNGKYIKPTFQSGMHGLVQDRSAGSTGALCETFDGGQTWALVNTTGPTYATDLSFVPGTANIFVTSGSGGTNGSSYSFNGGHSWYDFVGTTGAQYMQMTWLNNHCGWAGGINSSATENGVYKFIGILSIPLPPPVNVATQVNNKSVTITWQTPIIDTTTVTLLGYNIYRDNIKINSSLINALTYTDVVVSSGQYNYCVTSVYSQGESSKSCQTATVIALGINHSAELQVCIVPNPSTGLFRVVSWNSAKIGQIDILDFTGRVLISRICTNDSDFLFDLSTKPQGCYFVKVRMNNETLVRRLVISK